MRRHLAVSGIVALALVIGSTGAFAGSCSGSKQADLVTTAIEAGSFKTLVAAVQAAGLVDALQGEGPFTVFAPTDEAFAKLPAGTLDELLKPENKDTLTSILTYHVAPGRLTADKVVALDRVETLNGMRAPIVVNDGTVRIGDATVTATDIVTSNGVIHVIDTVLLPEAERASSAWSARELIAMAIDRGAPLYNHGQVEACAAIYEVAAQGLMGPDAGLSRENRRTLGDAMTQMKKTHDADRQAWIMRHALDDVMASLREDEMGTMPMSRR